ncbi:hypothetical protein [Phenylobacterium sp. J367]|nr:hypothetical protein [Phenylobacterium sp. J367]
MNGWGPRDAAWAERLWRSLPILCLLIASVFGAVAFLLGPDPGP